jgi:hypothetical protein
MANFGNTYGISTNSVEKAFEEEGERLQDAVDVKSDLSFVGIFANLIKKMDDGAQAAV